MKTANLIISKDALNDIIFADEINIQLDVVILRSDGQITFCLTGDDLPDECIDTDEFGDSHQVKLIISREGAVVNGDPYYKYTKEIKLK